MGEILKNESEPEWYRKLISSISETYQNGQKQAIQAVNNQLLTTYWTIGQQIVVSEQNGDAKSKYGERLLNSLSKDLGLIYGRGFSRSNLNYMRLLYLKYPICETLSHKLTWSHYCELIKIDDDLERSFYEKQTTIENWTVRALKRQKKAALYLRLAASKDKDAVLELAKSGLPVTRPTDLIREPFVLEFLKIPEPYHLSEKELESRIIEHLQHFLLELGKGFAFIGRQYRISVANRNHYVDLVFYHRILKCFVLIDLKMNEAGYEDIGQMNMYLGYFEQEENTKGDNPPIGIVLARSKDEFLIKYAMHGMSSQLFVSKYQLYLPDEDQLRRLIEDELSKDELE